MITDDSLASVDLRFEVSPFDPGFLVFGEAVGAITTHLSRILGYGAADIMSKTRNFSETSSGVLEVEETPSVHVGMELARKGNFPGI